MRSLLSASLRFFRGPLGPIFFGVALALLATLSHSRGLPSGGTTKKPANKLSSARNPQRLHLIHDAGYVFGWVSGTRDYLDWPVEVEVNGRVEKIKVGRGNTFFWPYKVAKATPVSFTVAGLRKSMEVRPPAKLPPCVFFVVDRGVYRPKQTLHFAAFLRDLDARGEFVPRPAQTVEVRFNSVQKSTPIASLQLTADAQGKLTGEYTFGDADPLDEYRLTIPGYKGEGRVRLAEYRKTQVRLEILSQRVGSEMRLRFQARDYLNRPVKASLVQYVAQVVAEPVRPAAATTLNAKQFAYAAEDQPATLCWEDLTLEERQLAEADDSYRPLGGLNIGRMRQVVTQIEGKLLLNERGEGVKTIDLNKKWLKPGHSVVVRGVLIDNNGREERRTKSIPILETADAVQLILPQSVYRVNEPIRVSIRDDVAGNRKGTATLAALRLSVSPPSLPLAPRILPPSPRTPKRNADFDVLGNFPPFLVDDWSDVRRELTTVVNFKSGSATLRLKEPGAYILVGMGNRPDGSGWRREVGCTILPPDGLPALRLELERDTYQTDETLAGTIHSKYADPLVLVTLRDSVGIRMWQTIRLHDGRADFKLPLPPGIHYGCAVEATYVEDEHDDEPVSIDSRLVHVVPEGRMLDIRGTIKPTLEPGEKAVLDLRVNRKEPVDLIVSVYDKSLLKVAADASTDINDFYLADDRIRQNHAMEVLRRRLDEATIGDLLKQARGWLKEFPNKRMTGEGTAIRELLKNAESQQLRALDVATLLRLAGIKARAVGSSEILKLPEPAKQRRSRLSEWLQSGDMDGWRLRFALIGDTFFVAAYHPTQNPQPWNAKAVAYYSNYYGMMGGMVGFGGMPNGGMSMMGMGSMMMGGMGMRGMAGAGMMGMGGMAMLGAGGLGGLAGIGGIAGLGGQGFNLQPQMPELRKPRFTALLDAANHPDFGLPLRRDFADSAYWNAKLRTDADGKAHIEFKLPDSLTDWQVHVTAISKEMHVGRHQMSFRTSRPLMVTPILPRFFTEGDKARLSANVVNGTDAPQKVLVRLHADNGKVADPADREITLAAHAGATVSWDFQAGDAGETQFLFRAESKTTSDAALKKLPIVVAGSEQILTVAGYCKDPVSLELPKDIDPSHVVCEVRFTPTLTADLLDTLPYLIDYPYGCVEQTMSRFLPAIQVAQTLKKLRLDDPELNRKLPGCVNAGIKRLLDFQHGDGGWGWWNNDATHEFMTPYALYGLIEAEKAGYRIGRADAIPRGLDRLKKFLDDSNAMRSADRLFCMYVYGQVRPLEARWWDYIDDRNRVNALSDYSLALALELAVRYKHPKRAADLADKLHSRANKKNGQVNWSTARFSRWGDDPLEVTAAVLKALVAHDKNDPLIPDILAYFTATKSGDRWNSTKATALIVHALCDYLARQEFDPRVRPVVVFKVNDGPEQKVAFARATEVRPLIVPVKHLRAGANRLTFTQATRGAMVRVLVHYWKRGRNALPLRHGFAVKRSWWLLDDKGKRRRELKSGDEVRRGAYVESSVEVQSEGAPDTAVRYVLVENRRPSGFEVVPSDDARFEQKGSPCLLREDRDQLVAYHHDESNGRLIDRCVLHAETPGEYLVAPARVEMMYRTEMYGHSGTFVIRIAGDPNGSDRAAR
jgi:hypothetical protein